MPSAFMRVSLPRPLYKLVDKIVKLDPLSWGSISRFATLAVREKIERMQHNKTIEVVPTLIKDVGVSLLFAFLLLPGVRAQTGALDPIFDSLRGVPGLYARHSYTINFILSFGIFFALVYQALSKSKLFGDSSSNILKALSTFLALGLSWGLTSLGGLGIFWSRTSEIVLLLLIAGFVFTFVSHLTGNNKSGFAWGIFLAYGIAVAGASPVLVSWIQSSPWLRLLNAIFLVFMFVQAIRAFGQGSRVPYMVKHLKNRPGEFAKGLISSKEQLSSMVLSLETTKLEERDTESIINDLKHVKKLLKDFSGPQERAHIVKSLQAVLPREHKIVSEIETFRGMINDILNQDFSFHSKLKKDFNKLSDEEKIIASESIEKNIEKIEMEKAVRALSQQAQNHISSAEKSLNECLEPLSKGDSKHAIEWIDSAINFLKKNLSVLSSLERLEQKLIKVLRYQIKGAGM